MIYQWRPVVFKVAKSVPFYLYCQKIRNKLLLKQSLSIDDLNFFSIKISDNFALSDVNCFIKWCRTNRLLNSVNMPRLILQGLKIIKNFYRADDGILGSVSSIDNLSIILDTNLPFNQHVKSIVCKTFRMLGFILCHTPSHIYSTKTTSLSKNSWILYCSLDAYLRRQNKWKLVKYIILKFSFSNQNTL